MFDDGNGDRRVGALRKNYTACSPLRSTDSPNENPSPPRTGDTTNPTHDACDTFIGVKYLLITLAVLSKTIFEFVGPFVRVYYQYYYYTYYRYYGTRRALDKTTRVFFVTVFVGNESDEISRPRLAIPAEDTRACTGRGKRGDSLTIPSSSSSSCSIAATVSCTRNSPVGNSFPTNRKTPVRAR